MASKPDVVNVVNPIGYLVKLSSSVTSFCRTKEAITGMSLGAVALFVIFSFIYPTLNEIDNAVGELQIDAAILKVNQVNQITTNLIISQNQQQMDSKLDSIIIIMCQQSNSSLCP